MQAKDIMTKEVIAVRPDTSVTDIAKKLLDARISAVPVVDDAGRVVGIVSEADLMRRAQQGRQRHWWLALVADSTAEFNRDLGTRARDLMTREVKSVEENTPIAEVARLLEANRIKRVPVLREGRLVGIVSRADLLRALAAVGAQATAPGTGDYQIRAEILELIQRETTVSLHAVSVIVVNGVVYLWGIADTAAAKDAIRIAAENVVGADKVHDYLHTLLQWVLARV